MDWLGLSTALGAFVAGVMLADTPFRHEIEADVEPFRSILLGLFFLAVGMMLDLSVIAANPMFVIGMTLALIAAKAAVIAMTSFTRIVGAMRRSRSLLHKGYTPAGSAALTSPIDLGLERGATSKTASPPW